MHRVVAILTTTKNNVSRVTEVVTAGCRQLEPVFASTYCRFEYRTPWHAAVILPGIFNRRQRPRDRHRAGANQRFDPAAVVQRDLDCPLATLIFGQPFARYRNVSIDSYGVLAIFPDSDKRAATQRAHAGLGVYCQQCGGQRTVDGVSPGVSDFTGRVSRKLRRGCNSD